MDEQISEMVRQHGWQAIDVNDETPQFLYTVGLMETYKHPDLIIFGLTAKTAYTLIAGLINDIRNSQSYAENCVHSIAKGEYELRLGFRRVHPTQHPLYLGFAMGYMRHIGRMGELDAMQVFWPDVKGILPFETGCDLKVQQLQLRLDIGLTPREVREFDRQWE